MYKKISISCGLYNTRNVTTEDVSTVKDGLQEYIICIGLGILRVLTEHFKVYVLYNSCVI